MKFFEIILILICAVYSAITLKKWSKANTIEKLFVFIAIITAVVVAWNAWTEYQNSNTQNQKAEKKDQINASSGDLKDISASEGPSVQIGENGPVLVFLRGWFNFPPRYPNLFHVSIKNSKLLFSTVLRGKDGNPIATIDDNFWKEFDKNKFEYNNDDSSFEIVTAGDRKVYFHIELTEGIARFTGLLYAANKWGLYFYNIVDSGAAMYKIPPDSSFFLPEAIAPYFKYPREKYLGVRVDK